MKIKNRAIILVSTLLIMMPVILSGQRQGGLDPASILAPLSDSWLTYSGDYSGKRYSALTQINQTTVKNLTLSWVARLTAGPAGAGGGPGATPTIVGGEGSADFAGGGVNIKGAILQVDGVLYLSAPDNAWAVDARDGHVLWHYFWKTKGGTHIGNRGLGMWHNYLFLETPDNYLVSLDAKTGQERWHKVIADFNQQYFSTMSPIVVGNHVLVGTGNDLDSPGFLQSYDPETGELQWKHYTVPMNPGDPGLETWPSLDAARHGGAQVWVPGAYDPETHLYIFGTGNPTPAYTTGRGDLDNLFTCSLVAVNVDTGKMAWYYQTSPHDTHDWDSTQTPVLADAPFNGRMRKLVMTAARNGYFFVLDRVTGEHLVTSKFGTATNWALGLDKNGAPKRNPEKDATVAGSLITGSITNWPPPAYSPDTGLFYVPETNAYAISYLIDVDPRGSMGLGGIDNANVGGAGNFVTAIDYRTGNVVWRHEAPGGPTGLLATAGKLLFAGSGTNLMAYDPATGKTLWHSRIGNQANAPETYMLDGHQYLLAVAGDTMFAFTLY